MTWCSRSILCLFVVSLCAIGTAHEGAAPNLAVVEQANSSTPEFEPFPADGVQLLSWLSLETLGADITDTVTSGNDCWGYVSPDGNEYALIGHSEGTVVVDITDPYAPIIIDTVEGPTSLWRDVKTYDSYAYAVSEGGGGVQVIDLTEVDDGTVTLVDEITDGGTAFTHNVAIDTDSGYLYRCGGLSNGLRIYDLSDPEAPDYVASWSAEYVHDVQVVTYDVGTVDEKEVAFCCVGSSEGLVILDVTDKADIVELSRVSYTGVSYPHQAWLTEDRSILYLNDETDEIFSGVETTTRIIDVTDLEDPTVLGTFSTGLDATDHNLYVAGDLIYEANYRSGLRVFDASDPEDPEEIAYFDVWPSDDDSGFNGLWSSYAFFPSGVVIGSDFEKGLFVWRIAPEALDIELVEDSIDYVAETGGVVAFTVTEVDDNELESGSIRLMIKNGEDFDEYDVTDLGGGEYEAEFPDLECGESVQFYLVAETTDGVRAVEPNYAPNWLHTAIAGVSTTEILSYDMETTSGWTSGVASDDAFAGLWTRGNPVGTGAQPEDAYEGDDCWVTGQGAVGGPLGAADVDGGKTTLTSPLLDLTDTNDPFISYWRWYSNNTGAAPEADVFEVDITDDDGGTWVNVETVGPTGGQVRGGWVNHQFKVLDFVGLTDEVRLRFIASDEATGSLVEAALDDFVVYEVDCSCEPFVRGDTSGDELVTIEDVFDMLNYLFGGTPIDGLLDSVDANNDGGRDISDAIFLLSFIYIDGDDPAAPYPDPGCP